MQILGSGYKMNVLLQFWDESDFPNSEIHDLMGSSPPQNISQVVNLI